MAVVSIITLGVMISLCTSLPVRSKESQLAEHSVRQLSSFARALHQRRWLTRDTAGDQPDNNSGGIGPSSGCLKLLEAWKKVQTAVTNTQYAAMLVQIKSQVMSLHGVDLNDEALITKAFCELAEIKDLNDLATFLHLDVGTVRGMYPQGVAQLNAGRQGWRQAINSPNIGTQDRQVLQAIVDFFDELENMGFLNLS